LCATDDYIVRYREVVRQGAVKRLSSPGQQNIAQEAA
jgi:hypothetical protein